MQGLQFFFISANGFKVYVYCVLQSCQIGIKTSKWFVVHYIFVELELEERF